MNFESASTTVKTLVSEAIRWAAIDAAQGKKALELAVEKFGQEEVESALSDERKYANQMAYDVPRSNQQSEHREARRNNIWGKQRLQDIEKVD